MSAILAKRFYSQRLSDIKINCSSCRGSAKAHSTGYAYEDKLDEGYWDLEFFCNTCSEYSRLWSKEYNALISQVFEDESPQSETNYQNR